MADVPEILMGTESFIAFNGIRVSSANGARIHFTDDELEISGDVRIAWTGDAKDGCLASQINQFLSPLCNATKEKRT